MADLITRKEYLDRNSTTSDTFALHREYYAQFVTWQERDRVAGRIGLDRIKEALKTDKHMNSIPLKEWDSLGLPGCRNSMKEAGDAPSLANGVCVWKEAARQVAEQST